MKIIHTSDWHLGRTFHGADLTNAFEQWCDFLVSYVRENEVDAVLVSGDIYDRGIPPVAMTELLSNTISQLLETTQLVITAGNHDSAKRLGFPARFVHPKLHLRTNSQQCADPITLLNRDGDPGAVVYALPYLDPDIERHRLNGESSEPLARSHAAVTRAALDLVATDISARSHILNGVPKIVMAHTFVVGGQASDSELDIHVGGVDSVPASLFRLGAQDAGPLSYVALGHLHGAQRVGNETTDPLMRYSGSPIAFSFSEEHHRKSFAVLEFATSAPAAQASQDARVATAQVPHVEVVEIPQQRKLTTIRDSFAAIMSGVYKDNTDDFVRVELTDEMRPTNLVARLRQVFPQLSQVVHLVQHTPLQTANLEQQRVEPLEVVKSFFNSVSDTQLSSEELELIEAVWNEVSEDAK